MTTSSNDSLARLALVIESRKVAHGGDPDKSYVARLLDHGPDAFLKKIGEEATEAVMAAKDSRNSHLAPEQQALLVGEMADLWFHSLVLLGWHGLQASDVLAELDRRMGLSGLVEKANRPK